MEDKQHLKLQYIVAVAHQQVFQQQLNKHRKIKCKSSKHLGGPWLHPERRFQFGIFDQLMVEFRREDHRTFKQFLCMPTKIYDEVLQRARHRLVKRHTWLGELFDPDLKFAATLRHLVSGAKYSDMQYSWRAAENTISVVVREVCHAIYAEYVDEVMTAPITPEEWKQLTDGFLKK